MDGKRWSATRAWAGLLRAAFLSILIAAFAASSGVTGAPRAEVPSRVEPAASPEPDGTPEPGATATPVAEPTAAPTPDSTPTPVPTPEPVRDGDLAIGLTEPNPNLLWPAESKEVPAPFAPWRDALAGLRPHFYRLQLDWGLVQPDRDAPIDLDRFNGGCMRVVLPCAPWLGLREQLRALAARQAQGGWEAVVAISGTPEWAARPPSGCERAGTLPRSRAPRADALETYRQMVVEVLAAAEEAGADLRWWNAWNEPNHPYFLSPQRATCDVNAPSEAVGVYTQLHAALGEALETAPGDQRRVMGDLAGTAGRGQHLTSVTEFIGDLPLKTLCETPVWAQHAYLAPRDDALVARDALFARGCPSPHQIWVTETGARNTAQDASPLRRCQTMHARLATWHAEPTVAVAFQYTAREDNVFPYGLIKSDLGAAYPVLGMWQAWGAAARPSPADAAPFVRAACPAPPPPGQ